MLFVIGNRQFLKMNSTQKTAVQGTSATFQTSHVKLESVSHHCKTTLEKYLERKQVIQARNGKIIKSTEPGNLSSPAMGNGFVGAAFSAYSNHHHLVIKPDDVWIAITTAFSLYVGTHADEMRDVFVDHSGKKKLVVKADGSLHTADYDDLISQTSDLIDKYTKGNIREWIEPNFSTTTPTTKIVGKAVLMGAMKEFFEYKFCLCCGLPEVTLEGTLKDWQLVYDKVAKLESFGVKELSEWMKVLQLVLKEFVNSYRATESPKEFQGKVDKDFWNRIATEKGFGSGPRYLAGWILAFIPFNEKGKYILNDYNTIVSTNKFGKIDTSDVPSSTVEVPIIIDDNGTKYKALLYAGAITSRTFPYDEYNGNKSIGTSLDWVLMTVD